MFYNSQFILQLHRDSTKKSLNISGACDEYKENNSAESVEHKFEVKSNDCKFVLVAN